MALKSYMETYDLPTKEKKIQLEGIVELMKREGRNFRVKGLNGNMGIGERIRWVELYKTNNTRRCPIKTYLLVTYI